MTAPSTHVPRTVLDETVRQLRATRARLENVERARYEPIAVVGAGVRLPGGVEDLTSFWSLLRDGTDAVSAGQLRGVDHVDAEFFGIGALEADHMDPQQRLVLEVAWEALEDANVPLKRLPANTGVFLGAYGTDYLTLQLGDPAAINAYTGPGGALSIAANRLSYFLDVRGPSLCVDTACSSSLVAVHLACRALRHGDCDLALVGGVNVILSPISTLIVEKVLPLSPTGRCRTFDAGADGIVRGEGCAMLVLERASDANARSRRIRGLIRGTAVNQDGRSNGLTAPSPRAQSELHQRALADASANPADVVYIEAHGTGTRLGDPIELQALTEVYGHGATPCAIGSVKANLGHLEAAAGIVGLLKAMLVLEHGYAPPDLHLEQLNPEIVLDTTRFVLPTELTPLPRGARPQLAAVSSFGFGGTNAHAVLEEPPAAPVDDPSPEERTDDGLLLAISARSERALPELVTRYATNIEGCDGDQTAELCAAAALQRTHHRHRVGIYARDRDELLAQLRTHPSATLAHREPRVAFIFSGQGSQWTGMGRELLAREAVVRGEVMACDEVVRDLAGWSVAEQLTALGDESRLNATEVAQVAVATLQLGLVALWRSWGVEPDAVAGHSMGEIVAACVAGALERSQALELLLLRGRSAEQAARGGRMASVGLPVAEVEPLVAATDGRIAIAADNGPGSTVVSGDAPAVERVTTLARAAGARTRVLPVDYGFHSPLLDPCRDEIAAAVASLQAHDNTLPLYSTVNGGRVAAHQLNADHWWRNLRHKVRFRPAIEELAEDGVTILIEIGPEPVLQRDIAQTLEHSGARHVVVASMRRDQAIRAALHSSLADLYRAGVDIDWDAVLAPPRKHVNLPRYPWQRQRHWITGATGNEPDPPPQAEVQHVDHTLYVRQRVCAAAGLDIDDVAEDVPLELLGLSSLSVVELRNQVERELGVVVPLAALLGGGTAADLAAVIREAIDRDGRLESTAVSAGSTPPST
jgi:acyl transferase domain-containing protein